MVYTQNTKQLTDTNMCKGSLILIVDEFGTIIEANEKSFEFTKYQRSQLIGLDLCTLDILMPRDMFAKIIAKLKLGDIFTGIGIIQKKDSSQLPITTNIIYNQIDGKNIYIITMSETVENQSVDIPLPPNNTVDMLAVLGKNHTLLTLNKHWENTLGWTGTELAQNNIDKFIHDDDKTQSSQVFDVIEGGISVFSYENRFLAKDGSYHWLLWSSFPLLNEKLILLVASDITLEKEAETINSIIAQAIEDSQIEAYVFDAQDFRIIKSSRTLLHNTGYSQMEMSNLTFFDISNDITKADFSKTLQPLISEGEDKIQMRFKHRRKDGSIYPVETVISFSKNTTQHTGVFVVIAFDITHSIMLEEKLKYSQYLLERVFENLNDLLVVIDDKHQIIKCNWKGLDYLSNEQKKAFSLCYEVLVNKEKPCANCSAKKVFETGKSIFVENINFIDGRIMNLHIIPLIDKNNKVTMVMEHFHDITEQKKAEQEREKLIADLEAKNKEMERFTYTISHDFKSPLITIEGFIGLLEQDIANNKPEQTKNDIACIRNATHKMNDLLESLLKLSRVGRIANISEIIILYDLVNEVIDQLYDSIEKHNVKIIIDKDLPTVYGDYQRLFEVFQNLIENAIKYTSKRKKGIINIGVKKQNNEYVFYVKDNGIGIKPQHYKKIFGLFEQLNTKTIGTGIGLALVKRIVEMYGGRIWVESDGKNKGSVFYFTLRDAMDDKQSRG